MRIIFYFEWVMLLIVKYFLKCLVYIIEGKRLKITQHNVEKELKKVMFYQDNDFPSLWKPYTDENPIPDNCIKMHVTKKLAYYQLDEFWKVFECPM